jgi:multidrug transporter EmrE-like cation transporter
LSSSVVILFKSLPFWTGMVCYGASVCVWLAALSKAPVSTAYPMLSLGYVVVAAVSVAVAGREPDARPKCSELRLICVICGVILVYEYTALDPDQHVGNTMAAVEKWKSQQKGS